METPAPMRFGVFLAPFHPDDENPTEQIGGAIEQHEAERGERGGAGTAWVARK